MHWEAFSKVFPIHKVLASMNLICPKAAFLEILINYENVIIEPYHKAEPNGTWLERNHNYQGSAEDEFD